MNRVSVLILKLICKDSPIECACAACGKAGVRIRGKSFCFVQKSVYVIYTALGLTELSSLIPVLH